MHSKFILLTLLIFIVATCNGTIKVKHKKIHLKDEKFAITIYTNGSYSLLINNVTWLNNADTFLYSNNNIHSTQYGNLVLNQTYGSSSQDSLGDYSILGFSYYALKDENARFDCQIEIYENLPLIRFKQTFKNQITGTKTNFNSVSSSFPSFLIDDIQKLVVGYLSFGGMMSGDMEKIIGTWGSFISSTGINYGMQGGPLVLFNDQGDTLVLSAMSNFMSASMQHMNQNGQNSINFGVMGGVDTIPGTHTNSFIVYYGDEGINKAMKGWGDILLKYYGKTDNLVKSDFTNNYLGYWTDNGAYYYWLTETGKNYQDTILDVVDYSNKINIPYRYMQYDSWWYGGPLGTKGGCSKWDSPDYVFPNGMQFLYNSTKLPASAHNKYWDIKVEYAKEHGGQYNFILDYSTLKALPDDSVFWDDLFKNATKWGLKTYEQDWLNHQVLDFNPLLNDIDLGRRWLLQMGLNAQKYNVTVQYCMSLSRHVLQSVEIPAVTQVRVTNDYATNWQYGGEQWRLGISSIFAYAVGLSPFKDVYWSTEVQPGNRYGKRATEPYAELESAITTLTAGPVGPGDRIGSMSKDIIMRCCNNEGLILKPSKPITALDEQIYAKVFKRPFKKSPFGEAWSTFTQISGLSYGIILAADMKGPFVITPQKTGFFVESNTVYWEHNHYDFVNSFTTNTQNYTIGLSSECTKKDFCLYYVAPLFNIDGLQVALLGEKNKWVPVSNQRITNIELNTDNLVVYINGVLQESCLFSFWIQNSLQEVTCTFSAFTSTSMKIVVTKSGITCN